MHPTTMMAFQMSTELQTIALTQLALLVGGIAKIIYDILAAAKARDDKEKTLKAALDEKNQAMKAILQEREQDRLDREQDRLDREQLADLTLEQLQGIKQAGSERERRLTEQVIKTRQVAITGVKNAKEAYREANNVNAKIASLGEQLVADKDSVVKVELVEHEDAVTRVELVEPHPHQDDGQTA